MSTVQVNNILVGYADLYWADYGTELPDLAEESSNATKLQDYFDGDDDWNYLGATQEGVELAYAPEYVDINVDQLADAAKTFFDTATVTLSTNLAEATLENLLVSWGFADDYLQQSSTTSQFSFGVQTQDPIERAIAAVGKGTTVTEGRRDRLYFGRRVVSVEGSSLAVRRNEATTYPCSFRLLPDPTFPNSQYGLIIDRLPGDETALPDADPFA